MASRSHIPPARRPADLSAESLRWTLGFLCAFLGASVLVEPHRYTAALYQGLATLQPWWAMAALGSGVALLTVALLRPGRPARLVVHGAAGSTLLLLAAGFASSGAWLGAVAYGILGLGLAAAGLLRASEAFPPGRGRDLFALLMGAVAVVDGVVVMALPRLFHGPYLRPGRPYLPALGAALLLSGVLLVWAHLKRPARWLVWLAHLAAGAVFVLFGLLGAWPARAWTGIAFYLGCGAVLAVLPWLALRFSRLDTRALRTRLALALATATSVAMILTAAVATTQEERLATEQVLETGQIEALSIAHAVADYVQVNAAQMATIAAMAGRTPLAPVPQRLYLRQTLPLFPRLAALATLDPQGRVVGVAGDMPLGAMDWHELAADPARDQRVAVRLLSAPGEPFPRLVLTAPIVGLDGAPAGVVVGLLGAKALARRITRPGSDVSLADGHGRTIARRNGTDAGADRSSAEEGEESLALPAAWDKQVATGNAPRLGTLATFARVPDLDWAVAVERPRRAALAGVREGRDLAFLLLLAVVPLALLGGIFVARRIARPLGTLADAVDELTAGNPGAPLVSSTVSEVARLSTAFAELRDRLAARTRESEQMAAELRARAEALADSDRRKDEFLAMLAHELRNPLGAIANSAYILAHSGLEKPPVDRSVAVIQRQIQHLVRLVDDLLDVSRISRGKVDLRREPIDLGDVVRHAVDTTLPLLEAKSHALRVDLPAEPLPLLADGTRLEQVVGNLLRNAAKYTDPGGRIEVSVRRDDGEAVLCVRDNGVGIAPDLLPRVFDLFTQGDHSLDRSGAGLGIGLTLVRRLVQMHGGRVEARSDGPQTGCEMEVRLPLVAPDQDQGNAEMAEASSPTRTARTTKRSGAEPM